MGRPLPRSALQRLLRGVDGFHLWRGRCCGNGGMTMLATPRGWRVSLAWAIKEVLPFAVGVLIWQALSSLNIWPSVLFPSPLQVFLAFVTDIQSGVLLRSLGVSLVSLGWGFLVGAAI